MKCIECKYYYGGTCSTEIFKDLDDEVVVKVKLGCGYGSVKANQIEQRVMQKQAPKENNTLTGWVAVSDRLPKQEQIVIVRMEWFGSKKELFAVLVYGDFDDHSWETADDRSELSFNLGITHWMPLPSKPTT